MKFRNIFKIGSPLLMGAVLFVSSCSSNEDGISLMEAAKNTRFISDTHVTLQHVQTLVGAMRPKTRAASSEEYVFITGNDGDTLFFVVNYPEGGWTMYASDMRVPAVVAECEKGKFVLGEARDVMGNWLEAMKEDMKAVRESRDEDLNFSSEEIAANRAQWDAVCKADEFVKSHLEQTRGADPRPGMLGHYVLHHTYSEPEIYDSIDHLTNTIWYQTYPYNMYCPELNGGHCAAGCVAIAGAQMLYYLHYSIGRPVMIPDMASCSGGPVNGNGNMSQWNSGANTWNLLPNHGNIVMGDAQYAAPLVAEVGKNVNTSYGSQSGANTANLVNNVFLPYGISSQYVNYTSNLAISSLNSSMPVIADAIDANNTANAHTFIIDRYKRSRTKTLYYYVWDDGQIPGGGPMLPTPSMPDSIHIEYSTPYISHIGMNWGEAATQYNQAWYSPTESWVVNMTGTPHAYDIQRHILYNFALTE